jgi:phosphatidate cytidylyltransferase
MHGRRFLSAVLLLPPLAALLYFGSPLHFLLVVLAVIAIAQAELYRLFAGRGIAPFRAAGIAVALGLALLVARGAPGGVVALGFALGVGAVLVAALPGRGPLELAWARVAATLFGAGYVGGLLVVLALLRGLPGGAGIVAYLCLVTWGGDTGAFYVGRAFGRRRLCPPISPGKTVEGSLGGLAASLLASLLAGGLVGGGFPAAHRAGLGLALGAAGQVGDLCESLLKRSLAAKDSGALIPGHGGLLDRLDSLLFSGPVLYLYLLVRGG